MFPLLNRTVPHVEEMILSFMEPKELATAVLVCKEWCQRAMPILNYRYATIKRKEEKVPLQSAIISGYDHLVSFFLGDKSVNVNETSKKTGLTALMVAATHGKERHARMLLEREDIDINMKSEISTNHTALHKAAANGHVGVVKILLERRDTNVNARGIDGATALMEAINDQDLRPDVIEELLKHPDINVYSKDYRGHDVFDKAHSYFNLIEKLKLPIYRKSGGKTKVAKIRKMLEESEVKRANRFDRLIWDQVNEKLFHRYRGIPSISVQAREFTVNIGHVLQNIEREACNGSD